MDCNFRPHNQATVLDHDGPFGNKQIWVSSFFFNNLVHPEEIVHHPDSSARSKKDREEPDSFSNTAFLVDQYQIEAATVADERHEVQKLM